MARKTTKAAPKEVEPKPEIVWRDVRTGEIVTAEYALEHPYRTERVTLD